LLAKRKQPGRELLNITMELGSTAAVKEALMAGYGFSILSRISIRHELDQGSIVEVPIRGVKLERGFYQVFHSRRPFHPIAQAFRDFLKRR
jgi:DNA-binding transcriptional LysR family regulator